MKEIAQFTDHAKVEIILWYDEKSDSYFKNCYYKGRSINLALGEHSNHVPNFPFTVFDVRELKPYGVKTECGKFTYWCHAGLTCDPEHLTAIRSIYWDEGMGAHEKEDDFECTQCGKKWNITEWYDSHKGNHLVCTELKHEFSYRDQLFSLFQKAVTRYTDELFEKHQIAVGNPFKINGNRISKRYILNSVEVEIYLDCDTSFLKNDLNILIFKEGQVIDYLKEKSKEENPAKTIYVTHAVLLIETIHSMTRDFEKRFSNAVFGTIPEWRID